jgi:hypothetical protein
MPAEEIEKLIPPGDKSRSDDLLSLAGDPVAEAEK